MRTEVIPKHDMVLFQQRVVERASGLVLPGGGKDGDLCKNIVIAVGKEVKRCKVGDDIMMMPKTAILLSFPERKTLPDLRMVKDENIIGVLKDLPEA